MGRPETLLNIIQRARQHPTPNLCKKNYHPPHQTSSKFKLHKYSTNFEKESSEFSQFAPSSYSVPFLSSTCVHAKSLQSCPTLCNPMNCSPPASSAHGILQARILEWVSIPSSRGFAQPRGQTQVSCISCIGRQVLYHWYQLASPLSTIPRLYCG